MRKGYKGRLYLESESNYRQRVYCAPACNPGAPTGHRRDRELAAVREAERREAEAHLAWLREPQAALGPYGHLCAVCGVPVRRGHPLHRDPVPERAKPSVVRL